MLGYASSAICTVYVDVTLTRSKVKVKVTDHLNFPQLPIKAHFQVYLLRHFRVELKTDGCCWQHGTWSTACRSPIFELPSRKAITRVQTSRNVDISRHSNGHIFWYWVMLQWHGWVRCIVLHILCMLMWPWPDPRSRSRSRGFWTSVNYRTRACWLRWPQPPCGAFWLNICMYCILYFVLCLL